MISLESYRIFLTVAREGSFSKGALKLYVTQPAVSQAIGNLEEKCGVRLFNRMARGVSLTSAGRILLEYIEPAFNLIRSGERRLEDIRDMVSGEIRISASDTFCMYYLPPYLDRFRSNYPGIRLNIANKTSAETVEMLKAGEADLGIMNLGSAVDENIQIWKKDTLEYVFIAKKGTLSNEGKWYTPKELSELPLLTLEKGTTTREHLENYFEREGIGFSPEMELGSIELLLRFTSMGMGISCMAVEFLKKSPYEEYMDVLPLTVPIRKRSIGVVTLKSGVVTGAAKAFIGEIAEEL